MPIMLLLYYVCIYTCKLRTYWVQYDLYLYYCIVNMTDQPQKKKESKMIWCLKFLALFLWLIWLVILFDKYVLWTSSSTPLTPEKQLQRDCFSVVDWSHRNVAENVKKSLKDPSSYEHIKTTYSMLTWWNIIVSTDIRWTNSFWAKVVENYRFETDSQCNIIKKIE